ncbi:MAG TPA: hypothetical protein VGJ66_16580 [Pyrinomonadaceae bacterium]|jgi:hypothetical protein
MLEFKQISHLDSVLTNPATRTLRANDLLGRWLNTNRETTGIAECNIERQGERFMISLVGVGSKGPIEWPRVEGKLLANLDEEGGQRAVAVSATFEFSFMKSETYIRLNRGVLVVVFYNTFLDNSSRANYVTREFFSRSA